ncbi:MAG: hypothetical protein ACK4GJ_03470 [bacterium]
MIWKKLGRIYHPIPIDDYLLTHASNPVAINLDKDIFRIFFNGRNKDNKSSVGFVDIDIIKRKVVNICKASIFTFGNNDSFYSHGVSIGNIYTIQDKYYIQFMGWKIEEGKHWYGQIGRLRLNHKLDNLKLDPNNVYMALDREDPISLSYSWVMQDDGIYKMWYGSTISWVSENGEMVHVIKYATSKDGIVWQKHGIAIPYELGVAQAFSKPTVYVDNFKVYHMFFSYRGSPLKKYRIGYARSRDGIKWELELDESGIDVEKEGWDSEMICYPFVFEHKGDVYMLYNGNEYGKTGFGLAILEQD